MKKNFLTIAVLALAFTNAIAQKGNVGINTTSPTETLHIKGTFRLENSNAGTGKVLVSDATGVGTWTTIPTGGGTLTNVTGTLPITASVSGSNATIGINRNNLTSGGTSSASATTPLTVVNGNGAVINGVNTTLTVNNTAALWNANQLNGTTVAGTPTNGQTLTYNGTSWVPSSPTSGTVTNFSAGDLTPLFTTTENTTTTTPVLNFNLTNAGANTIFGNNTAATGVPTYFSSANLPIAGNVTGTLGATVVSSIPSTADTSDWKLIGNAATSGAGSLGSASTNYIGTKDAKSLALSTNNITRAILGTDGSLNGGGGTVNSLSWGANNTASGIASVALGTGNSAIGNNSVAIGSNNNASSTNSIAIGYDAAGTNNTNSGAYSMALGYGNTVSGQKNFVLGLRNTVSAANTGISFQGGTFVLGNDNSVPSLNTIVIGGSNFTNQTSRVIGDRNGTSANPIGSGYTIGSNNLANNGGYIFGSQNSITGASSTGSMILGNSGTLSGKTYNTLYSNDVHYFKSTSSTTKTIVGINVDPSTFDPLTSAIQSDLTVNTSIRIVPQAPNSSCDSTSEGAIRYNATLKRHQGCDGSTWQNLY